MYKVFINNLPVWVTGAGEFIPNQAVGKVFHDPAEAEAREIVQKMMLGNHSESVVLSGKQSAEEMLKAAFSTFRRIDAAGGLVLNGNGELLLIYRNDKWDLPKGKIDKGEDKDAAALREVMEECGIEGHSLGKEMPSTWHCYEHKGQQVLKCTYWYIMHHKGTASLTPQLEENITKVEWRNLNDLDDVVANTYPSVIDCISNLKKELQP